MINFIIFLSKNLLFTICQKYLILIIRKQNVKKIKQDFNYYKMLTYNQLNIKHLVFVFENQKLASQNIIKPSINYL